MPAPVPKTLSVSQVREYDRRAIEVLGLPGAVLMENAGRAVAEVVLERLPHPAGRALVLAGPGNNGGDGYVIARHLANAGWWVELVSSATKASLRGDAALFRGVTDRMGIVTHEVVTAHQLERERGRWVDLDLVVDALLGTGFSGQLRPQMAAVLRAANGVQRGLKLAVDVPSGLDAETGLAAEGAFRADLTVTFVAPKPGLALEAGPAHTGELLVRGIGAPPDLLERPPV